MLITKGSYTWYGLEPGGNVFHHNATRFPAQLVTIFKCIITDPLLTGTVSLIKADIVSPIINRVH